MGLTVGLAVDLTVGLTVDLTAAAVGVHRCRPAGGGGI